MLRVMAYNIYEGARSDALGDRTAEVLDVIRAENPDILALPESNGFDDKHHSRLFEFERALGMRGYLALAASGYHLSVFARPGLQPIEFAPFGVWMRNAAAAVRFRLESGSELWFVGVHFNPFDEYSRVSEAGRFMHSSMRSVIMAGDLNALRPDDPDAGRSLDRMPGYLKARMGVGDNAGRLVAMLETGGFVDLFRRLHPGEPGPTHPSKAASPEGPSRRIDYVLATADLASAARECRVVYAPPADIASDHHPVVADFDL